jgi:hypothetical protein
MDQVRNFAARSLFTEGRPLSEIANEFGLAELGGLPQWRRIFADLGKQAVK